MKMDKLLDKIEKRAYQTSSLSRIIHLTSQTTDFIEIHRENALDLLCDLLEEQNEDISRYIIKQCKKAANAPTVQSEALTATKTTASGRYGDYTTAAARNQEEE